MKRERKTVEQERDAALAEMSNATDEFVEKRNRKAEARRERKRKRREEREAKLERRRERHARQEAEKRRRREQRRRERERERERERAKEKARKRAEARAREKQRREKKKRERRKKRERWEERLAKRSGYLVACIYNRASGDGDEYIVDLSERVCYRNFEGKRRCTKWREATMAHDSRVIIAEKANRYPKGTELELKWDALRGVTGEAVVPMTHSRYDDECKKHNASFFKWRDEDRTVRLYEGKGQ